MQRELIELAEVYLRHGSKQHRRRKIKNLATALEDIRQHEKGVHSVFQIGRKHISNYYRRHPNYSETTKRDKYYLFVLLWNLLRRPGKPPYFTKKQR